MSDAASDHEDAPPAQPAQSPRRQSRHRRRRPRSLSASSEEEEGPRRRSTKNTSGLPAVSEVEDTTRGLTKTAGGVVNQVGNTAGQLTGGGEKEATGSDKPLKLRLDVNLDVEITLEARVHGDLTLALLQVQLLYSCAVTHSFTIGVSCFIHGCSVPVSQLPFLPRCDVSYAL